MIDSRLLNNIMEEYYALIKQYKLKSGSYNNEDCKRIIGEIKLFWYKKRKSVNYILNNIEKTDNSAFLGGGVRLDAINGGHCDFALVGKKRIINDPILKMSTFYRGKEEDLDYSYFNKYLKETIIDISNILEEYKGDFYYLPLEGIVTKEINEYREFLEQVAKTSFVSIFSIEYFDIESFLMDNKSFEEIELKLLPNIAKLLIYNNFGDSNLSLREKCEKYLDDNKNKIKMFEKMKESDIFYLLTLQFFMQALSIVTIMKSYNMVPFIRNEVTFNYFELLYNSNIGKDITYEEYLTVYVSFVIQRTFDFSNYNYENFKETIGNGMIIQKVVNEYCEGEKPTIEEVIKCVEKNTVYLRD